ncbi:MAG: alpha/beta fold hydrolase [Chitinophagaceae bacterium]|nr:MAG: alpha/beta fold hydrolase [Chitinophagaceae bacterium]
MIKNTEKEIDEYFLRISKKMQMPPLYKSFEKDAIEVNGEKIHLDILRKGKDKPTIVFIPGTAIYAMVFTELLYKLGEAGFNIVGFDPRGHGRSGGKRGSYTITQLIDDTLAVTEYAKKHFNNDISLFGSSQGGIVAFYISAMNLPDIKSVVCQNFADLTAPDIKRLSRFPKLAGVAAPILQKVAKIAPELPVPINLYLDLSKEKLKHFGDFEKFIDQDPLSIKSIRLKALASLTNTPLPKPIEEISTPIMVIQGTSDLIFPVSYTRKLFNKLTCKKKLHLYPKLHHAMLAENVDEVLPPIIEWLNEIHEVDSKKS